MKAKLALIAALVLIPAASWAVQEKRIDLLRQTLTVKPSPAAAGDFAVNPGLAASGQVQITGTAGSQWVNVAAFDAKGNKIGADVTPTNGVFVLTVDVSKLPGGLQTVTVAAFSVPPGRPGGTQTSVPITLNVANAGGGGTPPVEPPVTSGDGKCAGLGRVDVSSFTKVFSDEFDGPLSISSTSPMGSAKWYAFPPNGGTGWYSQSAWDPSALSVANGILSVKLLQKPDGSWISGYLASNDTQNTGFRQSYGFWEACVQQPSSGNGSWPAFWLLFNDPSQVGEEVDIFEWYGIVYEQGSNVIQQATHAWNNGSAGDAPGAFSTQVPVPAPLPWQGFHNYGVRVDRQNIIFYIDGKETLRSNGSPTAYLDGKPMHIIICYAIGGGWPLSGIVNGSAMLVDWVRAYKIPGVQ
jgi:beta-glucanase (GH16 family)